MRAVLLSAVLASCYELPPEITEESADIDWPEGWPPPAVYVEEPLHPANRWFHRVHVLRRRARTRGETRLSESGYSAVDRAEVMALLEVLLREGLSPDTPAERRVRFRADLREEAERLRRTGEDGPLLEAYTALLERESRQAEDPPGTR